MAISLRPNRPKVASSSKIAPANSALANFTSWLWLGPLVYMLLVGLFFVARYAGNWAENDSALFSKIIQSVVQEAKLVPQVGEVYPNGYGFQAISAFLVLITGLDVTTLQQVVYPLLAAMVVLPAWLLYRELTGSARGATITTVLLFTQPEVLFVLLRSSHEKFTRTLMLLCLYWLVRSFKLRDHPWLLAVHVILFYFTAYAMIATNTFHSNSFIFAVAVALGLGWLLSWRQKALQTQIWRTMQRLNYVVLVCLGLSFVFIFYLYDPAKNQFAILKGLWERLAALFLDVQNRSSNAYTQVSDGWVSLPVYFMLSAANWLILVLSALIWLRQGWLWLWRKQTPPSQTAWLLWLFYAAFALQGVFSILADASGAIAANLQHRLFPSFSMLAVAIVGSALTNWQPRRFLRPLHIGLALTVFCFAILSVLKATNEPLLSNKWTFYRPAELSALKWTDNHMRGDGVWTEFDERLTTAFATLYNLPNKGNSLDAFIIKPNTRNILITSVTRLHSARLQRALPVPPDALLVFDNGEAQLYHLRPQTPYQR